MKLNIGKLKYITGSNSTKKPSNKITKAPTTFGDKVYRLATLPVLAVGTAGGAIAGAGLGAAVGGIAGGAAGMGLTSGILYGNVDSRSVNNKVKSLKKAMNR